MNLQILNKKNIVKKFKNTDVFLLMYVACLETGIADATASFKEIKTT